ncbi:MAG TPA: rhodanese-like domain-containing protein [Bryobacteraceae bacterium]|nr:rhodanese-like domain-containing protein [Bryobacteraceae bacterium]
MKRCYTAIVPIGIALLFGSLPVRGGEATEDTLKLIDQMKIDAEAKKDMPKEFPGVTQVTTEQAFKMWKDKSAIFLDNRVKTQFDTERIEGSQWYPADELLKDAALASKLDKAKTYIAYCNGAHCWRSPAVVLILKGLGYNKILWYRDGLPDWKKKGLATE